MTIIGKIAGLFSSSEPSNVLTAKDIFEKDLDNTSIGMTSESQALKVSAVMACVKVLSETMAGVPLILYEGNANGAKKRAIDNPLYKVLHDKPNKAQTSFDFRQQQQNNLSLSGNSLSEKIRDIKGNTVELRPLSPYYQYKLQNDGSIIYEVTDWVGRTKTLTDSEIFKVIGMSLDGVTGISPISYASKTIGLAKKAEGYSEDVFNGGGTKRVVLESPNKLKDPREIKQLRESWDDLFRGNSKTAVLENGLKANVVGMSAADTQYLESRKFQIEEISRIYRVPLHMIGELTRSTNNNIEQQSLEFVKYTMLPWFIRWEQAINTQLLGRRKDKNLFVKFNVDGLLRGDIKTRYEAYGSAIFNSFMTPNEARQKEDLNPIDGLSEILQQSSMVPFGTAREETGINE